MLDDAKWNSPTDTSRTPAPVALSFVDVLNTGDQIRTVEVTLESGAFLNGPSDREWQECIWENSTDPDDRRAPDGDGQAVRAFTAQDGFLRRPYIDMVFAVGSYRETAVEGVMDYRQLAVGHPDGVINVPEQWSLEIKVPWHWQEIDPAEMIHAIVRYYGGADALVNDLLNKTSFQAFSARMQDPMQRVAFDYVAKPGVSYGTVITEIARLSGALMIWGNDEGGVLTSEMRLEHIEDVQVNDYVFEVRQLGGGDNFTRKTLVIDSPYLRRAAEFLFNRIDVSWGNFVGHIVADVTSNTGNVWQQARSTRTEAGGLQLEADVINDESPNSVNTHGTISYGNADQLASVPMQDYANQGFNTQVWSDPADAYEITLGPEHLDFVAGDVIFVKDELRGLDGTEKLLVIEKTYNWDDMTALCRCIQWDIRPEQNTPVQIQDRPGIVDIDLLGWFESDDSGIVTTPVGGFNEITFWPDKSSYGHNLQTLARGTAARPILQPSSPAGPFGSVPYADFYGTAGATPGFRGLDWLLTFPSVVAFDRIARTGYTFCCVFLPVKYDDLDGGIIRYMFNAQSQIVGTPEDEFGCAMIDREMGVVVNSGGTKFDKRIKFDVDPGVPNIVMFRMMGNRSRYSTDTDFPVSNVAFQGEHGWRSDPDNAIGPSPLAFMGYGDRYGTGLGGASVRIESPAAIGCKLDGNQSVGEKGLEGLMPAFCLWRGHPTPAALRRLFQFWGEKYNVPMWS